MGNSQSTSTAAQGDHSKPAEQVIRPQEQGTSVQFAPSLISQLSSSASPQSPDEPPARTHHDSAIMARLAAETERLRTEEAAIMAKISSALEKENLDKEKPGMSSELLGRDMEEVREKLERVTRRRGEVLAEHGEVRGQRDAVVQCYLENHERPLDCWKEVEYFKRSVAKLEADFVASLR